METKKAVVRRGRLKTVLFFAFLILSVLCQAGFIPNLRIPYAPNIPMTASAESSQTLDFDPDAYNFLIYDSRGELEDNIQGAMQKLGITYDLRTPEEGQHVTLADLQSHDILIVGWNVDGSFAGLNSNILTAGITDRILLSGHDADHHTVNGPKAAETFLTQAIEYVLAGGGTGMITLGDSAGFHFLPSEWGVTPQFNEGLTVEKFTDEALASGVYDNLTPTAMSNWSTTYHDIFTAWGSDFVPFELGGTGGQEVITIARGNAYGLVLTKKDNIDPNTFPCAGLGAEVVYTISYAYPDDPNHTKQPLLNVVLEDTLPAGADYVSSVPEGSYDNPTRTVTWDIGMLEPGDPNYYFSLTVRVNNLSEPSGKLRNKAVLLDSEGQLASIQKETPVCCRDTGDIIYVRADATGLNTGTSWQNAYKTLQKAIGRINKNCGGSQIWVAKGIYSPGQQVTDTFNIPIGVKLFGSFAGWETSPTQRNIKANPTILSGDTGIIDYYDGPRHNTSCVKMGNNSLLDGFVVKGASDEGYGIYGKDIDFTVSNCSIEENLRYGLYADNCNISIKFCTVQKNGWQGINHLGNATESKTIEIANCLISKNARDGIRTTYSIPVIRNNQIGFNGTKSSDTDTYYGLLIVYPKTGYDIRNNSVIYNVSEGIGSADPNTALNICNCILYGNKGNSDEQLKGNIVARNSCIWDPNNIYTTPDTTYHNISCDPQFAYDGAPNVIIYHLLPPSPGFLGSPCINRGDNTGVGASEKDIDNEDRLMGTAVDMGADEIDPDCAEIYNRCDLNADGIVNYADFLMLSQAWFAVGNSNPNLSNPNYNPNCDLNHDCVVNETDLLLFIPNWAWISCWRTDIYNKYDFNHDGQVNMGEISMFAQTWLSDPNNPACPQCDLNKDNDNQINLADLMKFLEKAPWLWAADYRMDIFRQAQAVYPPQAAQQQTPPQEPQPPQVDPNQPQESNDPNTIEEPSLEQQIADLQDSIAFLENLWETDENIQQEISAEDWQTFMDSLYAQLADLQSQLPPEDPNDLIDPNDLFFGMQMMSQSGFGAEGMQNSAVQQEISDLQDSIQFLESLWDDPQFQQEMQASDWQAFMDELNNSLTELQGNDIITQ